MDTGERAGSQLTNETVINVASLLKSDVGAKRNYHIHLDDMALAEDIPAKSLDIEVRLTRLRDEILANAALDGLVIVECVRCLRSYEQSVEGEFAEEFRQTVDVRTGAGIIADISPEPEGEGDDFFTIDENHELDLKEAIRQHALLALPMRFDCGETCRGVEANASDESLDAERDGIVDNRFAALSSLLSDDAERIDES